MADISSLGVGSGIDVNTLLTDIVEAERKPTESRLDRKEAEFQAQLSSFGTLKGALSSFQTTTASLRFSSSLLQVTATSTDESAFSMSTVSNAKESSFTLEVSALAKAQSLASATFANISDTVGTGTLSFNFGRTSYNEGVYDTFTKDPSRTTQDVVITDGSLEGIRDAVNAASIGVTASIINVGSDGFKLLFTGDNLGANNSMEITVADDLTDNIDTSGLSQLAYAANAVNMSETTPGQDASVRYNGLLITRENNTISDLVAGVTFTLKAPSQNGSAEVSLARDSSQMGTMVDTFIEGYNELVEVINSLTSFAPEGGSGPLLGDAATRGVTNQIRTVLNEIVPNLGDNYTNLSSVGITTDADGKLVKDSARFESAVEADPSAVARLFSVGGEASGSNLNFVASTGSTQSGIFGVEISQPATRAVYTATTNSTLVINASNKNFTIQINGTTSSTISLTEGTYADGDALAAEMQAVINSDSSLQNAEASVAVIYNGDRLEITSNTYGKESKVELLTGSADLGLTAGNGIDGQDVAGTIGGVSAVGEGRFLTGSGDANGLIVEYTGSAGGAVGGITFSRGYADKLFNLMTDLLKDNSSITGKTEGIQASIDDIGEQRIELENRLITIETRLRKQFGAMDALVATLRSTGDFLTQQLSNLPKIGG